MDNEGFEAQVLAADTVMVVDRLYRLSRDWQAHGDRCHGGRDDKGCGVCSANRFKVGFLFDELMAREDFRDEPESVIAAGQRAARGADDGR